MRDAAKHPERLEDPELRRRAWSMDAVRQLMEFSKFQKRKYNRKQLKK
jgi:hypothetical protein